MRSAQRAAIVALLIALSPGSAATRPARGGTVTLTYPGKSWSLLLSLPGFRMERRPSDPAGPAVVATGRNRATGLRVSVLMEPAARDGDAVACRTYYWRRARRSPIEKTDVVRSERDGMAVVEYMVEEYGGVVLRQKNVNACLVREDIWIAIHLSKTGYGPEDRERFERLLRSVRFRDRPGR